MWLLCVFPFWEIKSVWIYFITVLTHFVLCLPSLSFTQYFHLISIVLQRPKAGADTEVQKIQEKLSDEAAGSFYYYTHFI